MHPTLIVIESNRPVITTMIGRRPIRVEREQTIEIVSDEYRSEISMISLVLDRIRIEHIETKNSLECKLYFDSICSIEIPYEK